MNVDVTRTFARSTSETRQLAPGRPSLQDAIRNTELGFNILGVEVAITADNAGDLAISSAFMRAYAEANALPHGRRLDVRIHRSSWTEPKDGARVAVHRTKHPYWTFDGIILDRSPLRVAWPSRKITCTVTEGYLEIAAARDLSQVFASESVFHAIRSVALPQRTSGVMVHASGIVVQGRALLFCGDVLAGKTTLMSEAVLRHAAVPLANDRILLTPDAVNGVNANSWPSYASYCEGTLLRYPTQSWPDALADTFDKNRKRIYPMGWFADAAGQRYARSAPLGALVFPKLALDDSPIGIRRLTTEECLGRLKSLVFGHPDPAFRPWHGIDPSEPMLEPQNLLVTGAASAFEITVPARSLSGFDEAISTIASRW
jgi:hypothetical protein